VRSDQRKTVDVLIDLLNRNIPAFYGVALLAVSAHLALVNVRVTVRALGPHIRKNQLGMALRTTHALVHTAERIPRGVVIEFRNRPNRLPTAECVAILAGNTKATVGTAGVRRRVRLSTSRFPAGENRQRNHQM
jgi:hypothetical protein